MPCKPLDLCAHLGAACFAAFGEALLEGLSVRLRLQIDESGHGGHFPLLRSDFPCPEPSRAARRRRTAWLRGQTNSPAALAAETDGAFLGQPLRDHHDFLLRRLDVGELHRPARFHVVLENFRGALRHVLQDLLLHLGLGAAQCHRQGVGAHLAQQRLYAAVVDIQQIVEYEQQILDSADASRRRPFRSCRVPRRSCRAPWHSRCWPPCAHRRCGAASQGAWHSPASRPADRAPSGRIAALRSSVAMRISTSVRMSSGSSGRMPADCSGSRCDSTMAAICGCSPPMICATAFASIHFSASMPWPVWPVVTRSSSMSAFCLPTAWVSTRRTKSCDPPAMFALRVGHADECIEHRGHLLARHFLELRHGDAQLLDFACIELLQHIGGILLAQAHQQDGGALRAGEIVSLASHRRRPSPSRPAPRAADPAPPAFAPPRSAARSSGASLMALPP